MHKINKHFKTNTFSILSVIVLCSLLSVSCSKKQDNIGNPYYIKAENCYNSGNYDKAIIFYKKYLFLFPYSQKASYKLASIYQEQEDFINAIYYFKKYLMLAPNSQDKPIIEKWIDASELSLYKELENEYSDTEYTNQLNNTEDADMKQKLIKLRKKNRLMRNFILKHKYAIIESRKSNLVNIQKKVDIHTKNNISTARTYKAKTGDNLYKIAEKLYGASKYYKLIWDANKDKLKKPSNLHPGDILIIPPLKNSE